MNGSLSPMSVPAQKQLKFSPGIVNGPAKESAAFINQTRKVTSFSNFNHNVAICFHTWLRKIGFAACADGTAWAVTNEKVNSYRTSWQWKTVEVEKKPSPMARAIQMEMAEAMETFRMD